MPAPIKAILLRAEVAIFLSSQVWKRCYHTPRRRMLRSHQALKWARVDTGKSNRRWPCLTRGGAVFLLALTACAGAADVRADHVPGLPVLRIVVDYARSARHGISVDDVLDAVEAIRAERVVGVVMDGVRRYDIVVKFALPLSPGSTGRHQDRGGTGPDQSRVRPTPPQCRVQCPRAGSGVLRARGAGDAGSVSPGA